jgi:hypothetical protein
MNVKYVREKNIWKTYIHRTAIQFLYSQTVTFGSVSGTSNSNAICPHATSQRSCEEIFMKTHKQELVETGQQ